MKALRLLLLHILSLQRADAQNQCSNCDCTAQPVCANYKDVEKPFSGVTINILRNFFGLAQFLTAAEEWGNITGGTVKTPLITSTTNELSQLIWEDISTGADFYDGYVTLNNLVPTLANEVDPETKKPAIMNLDDAIKNSESLDWPGVHSIFREYLCLYDNSIFTIPLDGDIFHLYYRRDLQERDGWEVPQTWDDLLEVASQYEGQDLDGDGEPDFAMCQPNIENLSLYTHLSILAGLLQTHSKDHPDVKNKIFPKRHGIFFGFGEDGLEPLVKNDAMRRALPIIKRMYELGNKKKIKLCCGTEAEGSVDSGHGLMRTGKCAFYYNFPSVGPQSVNKDENGTFPLLHGKMGTTMLPAWTEYLDRESGTLKPCTSDECPHSVKYKDGKFRNVVSFYANGGMGSVINGRVSETRQRAAFSFFSYFSKTLKTTFPGTPYNPFRIPGHTQIQDYLDAEWEEKDASIYLDSTILSLDNENAVMDLRVPNAAVNTEDQRGIVDAYIYHIQKYLGMLDEQLNGTMVEPEMTDEERIERCLNELHDDVQGWIDRYDTRIASSASYWTGEIEKIYRGSISAPLREAPIETNLNLIGGIRWFGWTLAFIAFFASVAASIWVVLNKTERLIKASQPLFLHMMCAGNILMALNMFPAGIDDSMMSQRGCTIACNFGPWLLSIGFTVAFSAVFSKIWRINKIMRNSENYISVKVTERDVMIPFAVLFSLNFICLLVWTAADPLIWVRIPVDPYSPLAEYDTYGTCRSNGKVSTAMMILILIINLSSLILAVYQAYQSRNVSTEFSESKYIGFLVTSWLQVLVVGAPLLVIVKETPVASFILRCCLVFVICISMLSLMFIPKYIALRKQKQGGDEDQGLTRISGLKSTSKYTSNKSVSNKSTSNVQENA